MRRKAKTWKYYSVVFWNIKRQYRLANIKDLFTEFYVFLSEIGLLIDSFLAMFVCVLCMISSLMFVSNLSLIWSLLRRVFWLVLNYLWMAVKLIYVAKSTSFLDDFGGVKTSKSFDYIQTYFESKMQMLCQPSKVQYNVKDIIHNEGP